MIKLAMMLSAAAMMLGACASGGIDPRYLYGATAAAYGLDVAAGAAVDNKVIVAGSPTANKIASLSDFAHTAITLANTARLAGDAKAYNAAVNSATLNVGSAWPLVQKGNSQ